MGWVACSVLAEDPSAFGTVYTHKYFHNFYYFIWSCTLLFWFSISLAVATLASTPDWNGFLLMIKLLTRQPLASAWACRCNTGCCGPIGLPNSSTTLVHPKFIVTFTANCWCNPHLLKSVSSWPLAALLRDFGP